MATTSFKKPGFNQDTKLLITSGVLALVAIVTLIIMLTSSAGMPTDSGDSAPTATAPAKPSADAGDE